VRVALIGVAGGFGRPCKVYQGVVAKESGF